MDPGTWLRSWRGVRGPSEAEREALEQWVRRRFQMASSDPIGAVIGAVGRLTDAGMTQTEAVDTALRILRECDQEVEGTKGGDVADSQR